VKHHKAFIGSVENVFYVGIGIHLSASVNLWLGTVSMRSLVMLGEVSGFNHLVCLSLYIVFKSTCDLSLLHFSFAMKDPVLLVTSTNRLHLYSDPLPL
jgi:hypothetical protein